MTTRPQRMLPLYEAKLIHQFDHRWATYERDGTVRDVTLSEKRDPDFEPLPRYWVREEVVDDKLADRWDREWLYGWRDICRSTDERTTISSPVGMGASPEGGTLLCLPGSPRATHAAVLAANFNAFAFDFVARQKVGGTHLKYFTLRQLPTLSPSALESRAWLPSDMGSWISSRVLELSYTSRSLASFAKELGDKGAPFRWDVERRVFLRAELDAGFFHLYGVERDDVDYIMETFPIIRRKDIAAHAEFRTKRVILEIYDAMQRAIDTGTEYETILDPAPGHGPRHTSRTEAP